MRIDMAKKTEAQMEGETMAKYEALALQDEKVLEAMGMAIQENIGIPVEFEEGDKTISLEEKLEKAKDCGFVATNPKFKISVGGIPINDLKAKVAMAKAYNSTNSDSGATDLLKVLAKAAIAESPNHKYFLRQLFAHAVDYVYEMRAKDQAKLFWEGEDG
jgi:hypothetical protein